MDIRVARRVRSGGREFNLDVAFATDQRRVVLFGPSGAGKSMTVGAIAGLVRPDRGHIALNGRVLFDSEQLICLAQQQRTVAYRFEDYGLFTHLTVAPHIGVGIEGGWRNPTGRRSEARR